MDAEQLIASRDKIHGDFERTSDNAVTLTKQSRNPFKSEFPVVQHAREMICVKLARMASGDPNALEHWEDVAGYATLAADYLKAYEKPRG